MKLSVSQIISDSLIPAANIVDLPADLIELRKYPVTLEGGETGTLQLRVGEVYLIFTPTIFIPHGTCITVDTTFKGAMACPDIPPRVQTDIVIKYDIGLHRADPCGSGGVIVTPTNLPPVVLPKAYSTGFQTPITLPAQDIVQGSYDPEGQALIFVGITEGIGGTAVYDPATNSVLVTPTAGYSGPLTFNYTLSDGLLDSTATVVVQVGSQAGALGITTAPDNVSTAYQTPVPTPIATLLGNDTTTNVGPLTLTGVTAGYGGTPSIVGTDVVFTPMAGFQGQALYTYQVSDGVANSSGIVYVDVSDNPVVTPLTAVDDTVDYPAGQTKIIPTSVIIANDTGVGTLTVTNVSTLYGGTVSKSGNDITWIPNAGTNSDGAFQYTLSDGTNTTTAKVTMHPTGGLPDPLQANNYTVDVGQSTTTPITFAAIVANDTGQAFTITSVSAVTGGTPVIVGNTVEFTSSGGYSGPYSFNYTITDGAGATSSAVVSGNVASVNTGPIQANDISRSANVGQDLDVSREWITSNDVWQSSTQISIDSIGALGPGSFTLFGGTSVLFTPPSNTWTGETGFNYTISENGVASTARVTYYVGVTPPVTTTVTAGDVSLSAAHGVPTLFTSAQITVNDTES